MFSVEIQPQPYVTGGKFLFNHCRGNLKYYMLHKILLVIKKKKLRGFSPQANYTDRAIAAGQRS
jgi:hypothetical protein